MLIARKLMAGAVEFLALALFVGMIWVWAALASAPHV
ncbi:hypothetical protein SAMN04515666_101155 [Bosea lupini]|jgi:hypothetical protein|uniref:Uncharacterized protein n=1 Tax=Bosea lupini TaxID=1036779 RepID=A0A1H7FTI7_9HYPH|nr:hypothetical protein SAMN04515666_101155 [Bosea lupini]